MEKVVWSIKKVSQKNDFENVKGKVGNKRWAKISKALKEIWYTEAKSIHATLYKEEM